MAFVSSSKEILNQNIEGALDKTIQILGSTDIHLIYFITGFLGNIPGNNNFKVKVKNFNT